MAGMRLVWDAWYEVPEENKTAETGEKQNQRATELTPKDRGSAKRQIYKHVAKSAAGWT